MSNFRKRMRDKYLRWKYKPILLVTGDEPFPKYCNYCEDGECEIIKMELCYNPFCAFPHHYINIHTRSVMDGKEYKNECPIDMDELPLNHAFQFTGRQLYH